jgi:alpha-galactosidase
MVHSMLVVGLMLATTMCVECLENGLGRTPPMGFNTWNTFHCIPPVGTLGPSDQLMRSQADTMVSSGMAKAGYVHVNIDDCWQMTNRTLPWDNPKARQIANPQRFPHGMKALADYLHSHGLKFGLYSARCRYTCQLFAASFGHEAIDAQQWADWGVDYLKMDECYGAVLPPTWTGWDDKGVKPVRSDGSCHDLDPDPIHRLGVMRDALNASGRPIFFSNEYPAAHENYPPYGPKGVYNFTWMAETHGAAMGEHANMWRISRDIGKSWTSILNNIDFDEIWAEFAQPGSINDPDMLQVGNGLTESEDLSHFSMWCMLAAPLLAGNDLTKMTPYVRSVLLHDELIAINQDVLVSQAVVAKEGGRSTSKLDQGWQLWKRPLSDGSTAALLLNRGNTTTTINVDFSDLGIIGSAKIRDVWARKDLGSGSTYNLTVLAHGSRTLKLTASTRINEMSLRVCDAVRTQDAPRFTRPYVQLDCAVGESIVSIDRVAANDLDGWRCGDEGSTAAAHEEELALQARAACVGQRSCRVRLNERRALALEGTCK